MILKARQALMVIPLSEFLKRRLPHSWRQKIKKMAGLDIHPEKMSTLSRVDRNSRRVNIAIRTGGGLGDFIVYLAVIDQLLARCDCDIHIFTLSRAKALSILGGRERVFVQYPFGFRAEQFDLVLTSMSASTTPGVCGARLRSYTTRCSRS